MQEIDEIINKYFNFLIEKYSYVGPYKWRIAYEDEYTFIKNQYYVNIGYDGAFFVEVGKLDKTYPKLLTGEMTLSDIPNKHCKSHTIDHLFSIKELMINLQNKSSREQLLFYARSIEQNPEILHGDWYKFSWRYKRIIRLKSILLKIKNS